MALLGTICIRILLLFFVAGTVFAQTKSDRDLLSLDLEQLSQVKVYGASRRLEEARLAPASITIITREEIRRYGWRTLADVLRSVRGFYTSYDRSYSYLGVRGFLRPGDYNSRVLLLLNGHRINENVYGSAQIGTEFPLDLELIDHIEVVRGPGSALFGTNAIFGVINIATRAPSSSPALELSGDISSFLTRAGRLTGSTTRGRFSGLVSGSLYQSAGQSRLFYPEFSSTSGGIASNVDGDRYTHLFSDLRYRDLRVQALYGSRRKIIPTAEYETNFSDPGTRITDSTVEFDVDYKRNIAAKTEMELRAFFQHYSYDGRYAYGGTNSPDRYLNFDRSVADWSGAEAILNHQFGRHELTVGANYEYSFRVNQQNWDAGQPFILNDHRTPWLVASFAEIALDLGHDLKLHAGGRVDYFDYYGTALSPRAALIYAPGTKTSLKYVFGRAFRSPNAYENYYVDGVSTERPLIALQKENIQSHEVVFERKITPWLAATLDGYYNQLENLIDWVEDPGSGMTHARNAGKDRGRGIEFEIGAKRSSGLQGRASYALADARDQIHHDRLDNAPLHQAKLNAILPVTRYAFAGVELLYFGAQRSYRLTQVQPSLLMNITLSTKPMWGGWQLSGSCYNAADRQWFSPAPPSTRQAAILQDGRTFSFKLSYRLGGGESGDAR